MCDKIPASMMLVRCLAVLLLDVLAYSSPSSSYAHMLNRATTIINPPTDSSAILEITTSYEDGMAKTSRYLAWFRGRDALLLKKIAATADSGRIVLIWGSKLLIQLPSTRRPVQLSRDQRWASDAAFADMARVNFRRDYKVETLTVEKGGSSELHFVLKPAGSEALFQKIDLWLDQNSIPLKAAFELSNGRSRFCEYRSFRTVLGMRRPTELLFHDPAEPQAKTKMVFSDWKSATLDQRWFIPSALGKMELVSVIPARPALDPSPASYDDMVYVPASPFVMGRDNGFPDERPAHQVSVGGFWLDRYEVTVRKFQRFFADTHTVISASWSPSMPHDYLSNFAFLDFPVVNVNWYAAKQYCLRQGKRLPSEAEWEKAARGTDQRLYPWGNQWDEERANSRESPYSSIGAKKVHFTVRVGEYEQGASPYGILDMAGNVSEWVEDWYTPYPGNDVPGDAYGQKYKVIRGGSWVSASLSLTTVARDYSDPRLGYESVGFRCAKVPDGTR